MDADSASVCLRHPVGASLPQRQQPERSSSIQTRSVTKNAGVQAWPVITTWQTNSFVMFNYTVLELSLRNPVWVNFSSINLLLEQNQNEALIFPYIVIFL